MDILAIIIFAASISNLFLGFLVFIKDPAKRLNRLFGIFGLILFIWCFTNFALLIKPIIFWLKSTYAFGSLVVVSAVLWALDLNERKLTKFKIVLTSGLGLFFFLTSYFSNLIVIGITKIYPQRVECEIGPLFPLFSIYLFGMLAFIIYLLISGYKKASEIKKLQLSYILIGSVLYISIVLIAIAILPLFGNFNFVMLDSPSSLIFVLFTALAITRYHLFEIKVILTELLVGIMAIISLIQALLPKTLELRIFGFIVFITFCFIAYLLVKSTHRETKAKEILEEKVKEKTKELQTAYEEIEKRKGDLEKFYKLTVGRELRMVELKKEIKQKSERIKELEEKLK